MESSSGQRQMVRVIDACSMLTDASEVMCKIISPLVNGKGLMNQVAVYRLTFFFFFFLAKMCS